MNEEEAERLLNRYEKWDLKHTQQTLFSRMERRLFKRNRLTNRREKSRLKLNLKPHSLH